MNQDDLERRAGWLAFALDEALRAGVMQSGDVLTHVTPEVLAEHLPRELMVKVFASAFATGKLTPEGILTVAPPATLVRHVGPPVLWASVREAAHRSGVDAPSQAPRGRTPVRAWLGGMLAQALERGLASAADVTRHIAPRDWVREVPVELAARMLAAGLTRPAFDAALALEFLTPDTIGEHIAPHLTWGIVDEAATRAFNLSDGA